MNNQPQSIPSIPASAREAIYFLATSLITLGIALGLISESLAGPITAAVGALINAAMLFRHRPTKLGQP